MGALVLAVPAAGQSWSAAGALAIDRLGHQATLLDDGRVLVTGGNSQLAGNGGYDTRLAELYDPGTNTWSTTGSTANGRDQSTAARLADGRVLVAGGVNANICAGDTSAEVYSPSAGTWSFTGSLVTARAGAAAVALANGKVLMIGGGNRCGAVYSSVEIYDPGPGTWSAAAAMNVDRERHSAVRLLDGRVLVAGGQTFQEPFGPFPSVSSAEIYDPATNTWTPTGSMTTARSSFAMTLLADGRVLAAAGYFGNGFSLFPNGPGAEIFDPATGTWSATGSMTTTRSGVALSLLGDDTVLATGGYDGANTLSSAETWDPGTGTWSLTASMAGGRIAHTNTVLQNGNVLVAAGYFESPRSYLTSAELYVVSPEALVASACDDLAAAAEANAGTPVGDKLEDAAAKCRTALGKLAQEPPDRQGAAGAIEGAVGDLEAAGLGAEAGTLLEAARLLATDEIDAAVDRGGNAGKIAEAMGLVAEGDSRRTAGANKDAAAKYKDALSKAEGA